MSEPMKVYYENNRIEISGHSNLQLTGFLDFISKHESSQDYERSMGSLSRKEIIELFDSREELEREGVEVTEDIVSVMYDIKYNLAQANDMLDWCRSKQRDINWIKRIFDETETAVFGSNMWHFYIDQRSLFSYMEMKATSLRNFYGNKLSDARKMWRAGREVALQISDARKK